MCVSVRPLHLSPDVHIHYQAIVPQDKLFWCIQYSHGTYSADHVLGQHTHLPS